MVKEDRPTRVGEVAKIMVDDVKSAILLLHSGKIVQASAQIGSTQKMVLHSNNGDNIIQMASNHPLTVNDVILGYMDRIDPAIDTLVSVHMINRILAASRLTWSTTFANKYNRHFFKKVPFIRHSVNYGSVQMKFWS